MQFDNKGAAVARMIALNPELEQSKEELGAFNAENITYNYRKVPVDPIMGTWALYVYAPAGVAYADLEAAIAGRRAHIHASRPECPAPNVSAVGGWVDTHFVGTSPHPTTSRHTISITGRYILNNGNCVPATNSDSTETVSRNRSWTCPSGYSVVSGQT